MSIYDIKQSTKVRLSNVSTFPLRIIKIALILFYFLFTLLTLNLMIKNATAVDSYVNACSGSTCCENCCTYWTTPNKKPDGTDVAATEECETNSSVGDSLTCTGLTVPGEPCASNSDCCSGLCQNLEQPDSDCDPTKVGPRSMGAEESADDYQDYMEGWMSNNGIDADCYSDDEEKKQAAEDAGKCTIPCIKVCSEYSQIVECVPDGSAVSDSQSCCSGSVNVEGTCRPFSIAALALTGLHFNVDTGVAGSTATPTCNISLDTTSVTYESPASITGSSSSGTTSSASELTLESNDVLLAIEEAKSYMAAFEFLFLSRFEQSEGDKNESSWMNWNSNNFDLAKFHFMIRQAVHKNAAVEYERWKALQNEYLVRYKAVENLTLEQLNLPDTVKGTVDGKLNRAMDVYGTMTNDTLNMQSELLWQQAQTALEMKKLYQAMDPLFAMARLEVEKHYWESTQFAGNRDDTESGGDTEWSGTVDNAEDTFENAWGDGFSDEGEFLYGDYLLRKETALNICTGIWTLPGINASTSELSVYSDGDLAGEKNLASWNEAWLTIGTVGTMATGPHGAYIAAGVAIAPVLAGCISGVSACIATLQLNVLAALGAGVGFTAGYIASAFIPSAGGSAATAAGTAVATTAIVAAKTTVTSTAAACLPAVAACLASPILLSYLVHGHHSDDRCVLNCVKTDEGASYNVGDKTVESFVDGYFPLPQSNNTGITVKPEYAANTSDNPVHIWDSLNTQFDRYQGRGTGSKSSSEKWYWSFLENVTHLDLSSDHLNIDEYMVGDHYDNSKDDMFKFITNKYYVTSSDSYKVFVNELPRKYYTWLTNKDDSVEELVDQCKFKVHPMFCGKDTEADGQCVWDPTLEDASAITVKDPLANCTSTSSSVENCIYDGLTDTYGSPVTEFKGKLVSFFNNSNHAGTDLGAGGHTKGSDSKAAWGMTNYFDVLRIMNLGTYVNEYSELKYLPEGCVSGEDVKVANYDTSTPPTDVVYTSTDKYGYTPLLYSSVTDVTTANNVTFGADWENKGNEGAGQFSTHLEYKTSTSTDNKMTSTTFNTFTTKLQEYFGTYYGSYIIEMDSSINQNVLVWNDYRHFWYMDIKATPSGTQTISYYDSNGNPLDDPIVVQDHLTRTKNILGTFWLLWHDSGTTDADGDDVCKFNSDQSNAKLAFYDTMSAHAATLANYYAALAEGLTTAASCLDFKMMRLQGTTSLTWDTTSFDGNNLISGTKYTPFSVDLSHVAGPGGPQDNTPAAASARKFKFGEMPTVNAVSTDNTSAQGGAISSDGSLQHTKLTGKGLLGNRGARSNRRPIKFMNKYGSTDWGKKVIASAVAKSKSRLNDFKNLGGKITSGNLAFKSNTLKSLDVGAAKVGGPVVGGPGGDRGDKKSGQNADVSTTSDSDASSGKGKVVKNPYANYANLFGGGSNSHGRKGRGGSKGGGTSSKKSSIHGEGKQGNDEDLVNELEGGLNLFDLIHNAYLRNVEKFLELE